MTARQEARLEKLFAANESLKHHGGSHGIARILNRLGDQKVVRKSEVALWWHPRQTTASRRRRKKDVKDA